MERDPVLELAGRWRARHGQPGELEEQDVSVEYLLKHLHGYDIARRITDGSLRAVNEYVEWHLDRLWEEAPSPGSIEMYNGLITSNGTWTGRLMQIRAIGMVNYHAARLYGSPASNARVANTLARFYYRIGMKNVGLALLRKAAETLKDAQQPASLVFSLIQVGNAYRARKLYGKAWNYLSVALPLADQALPALRGSLWDAAAACLNDLHRHDEAAVYYQKIADMPESAELPSLHQATVLETLGGPGKPISGSLKEEALYALEGTRMFANGKMGHTIFSDYIGFRPDGALTLSIETPDGLYMFLVSSHHELYDQLQRRASQLLTIRGSLSWRGSATDYLRGWMPLIEALVETAHKISLPHRALEWLEAFRATTLLQRLAIAAGRCPEGIDPDEWARLEELFRRYRAVIESETDTSSEASIPPGLNAEELEGTIRGLVGDLRNKHPHLNHRLGVFTLRRGLPDRTAFEHLPEHTRILEYFCGADCGGCWIIDPADPRQPVWVELPGLTEDAANLVANKLQRAQEVWKNSERYYDTLGAVEAAIDSAISFVQDTCLRPLLKKYLPQDIRHLVVIPHRALSNLPFHAAVDIDRLIITYAPSLTVLASLKRSPQNQNLCGVIAADSLSDGDRALPGAQLEGRYVAHQLLTHGFSVEQVFGSDVTVAWLEERIAHATVLHLGVHGIFDQVEPSHSGLLVAPNLNGVLTDHSGLLALTKEDSLAPADEDAMCILWTLKRIWQRVDLSQCKLAFMADCETSVVDLEAAPDEFLALAGGFLQAGAPTVIGGLWELGDLATLLCTREFYRLWLDNDSRPSEALFQAQCWLRRLTVQQILDEAPDVLMDCYRLEHGADASTPEQALAALIGKRSADDLPFASPFFWAPLRCVGIP